MSIPFFPYTTFLIITGMKASGKTFLTRKLLKMLNRIIVLDSTWELGDLGYEVHHPERIKPAFLEWKKIVYQPMHDDDETWNQVFHVLRNLANYTLGINEIDQFTHGQWYISEDFKHIVRRGRIQGIGQISNTRRPSLFHRDIRNSADVVVCFHLHEEDDVKYMSKWIGASKEEIKGLQKYWSWLWIAEGSKLKLLRPI